MTRVIPAGSPPWTRTATMENFGGHLEKQDYLHRGSIDSLTDVGAASFARMTSDMTALVRTAPLAIMRFGKVQDGARVVSYVAMPTGVQVHAYAMNAAAPVDLPRVDREGTGTYLVSFPTSLTDSYGVSAPFSIMSAMADPLHTAVCRAVVELVSSTVVRARVYDASDTLIDSDEVGLEVY